MLDVDFYAALQFRHADWISDSDYNTGRHKLAKPGSPNYGSSDCYVMPGFRTRLNLSDDITLMTAGQYNVDDNRVASADAALKHRISSDFSYFVDYSLRDFRYWDFSSTPYDPDYMTSDGLNEVRFHNVHAGFEQQPLDWFAWRPFIRWDVREGDIDSVGGWFDYLTDCLGFRLVLEYRDGYTSIDRRTHDHDYKVGFYIYLRALGADKSNIFKY